MNWRLLLVGFAVHLVFFYSIFDIYFTSPLVQGMSPQVTKLPPPAKRLVLLVADGLRADKAFELDDDGQSRAPFLRSKMEKEGAWGVSHTRVPTESRPGHVALIAGFYEDVSAVAKGWKENPIEFDSVFNESRQTWAWGSPDILPMFAKGSSGDHVLTEVYPNESEDFAGANLHKLDTWVFDKVDEFLDRCNNDAELKSLVKQDQIVLFLHLLGIDTNGHAHKPDSNEYLSNIRVVDSGIRQLVTKLEDFFDGDNGTAYVFSADHGMTNWGSHGAGHPSETLTPLVAWGAGIRSALPSSGQDRHYTDNYQHEWNLDKVKRSDVNQADIAPLMSALIGIPFPMNSVGLLPLDYLSGPSHYRAESLFTNTRQILAQFEIKMRQKQETTLSVLFTPYKLLTPSVEADRIRQISSLIQRAEYNEAIQVCQQTISLALEGLSYYHNYDRLFLGISITCGYLGWMTYILTTVLKNHTTVVHKSVKIDSLGCGFLWSEKGVRVIFLSLGGVIAALLYAQSLPWSHYLYCIIPVVLWKKVFQRRHVFQDLVWYVMDHGLTGRVAISCVVGLAGLEIMVLSFFHRELLTLGLVAMGIWIFFTPMPEHNKGLAYSWLTCCLITAIFPLMPVMGRQVNYSLVYLAGILSLLLVIFVSRKPELHPRNTSSNGVGIRKFVIHIQVAALALSIYIVWSTTNSLNRKEGLPLTNQLASWTILGSSFVLPMLTSTHLYSRLLSVALSMASPYLLLSTAQEGLFLVSMCALMFMWIQVENQLSAITAVRKNKLEELDFGAPVHLGQVQRKLIPDDLRCAFFFIFFLLNGFFGTGNIASINTFDPRSVFCFLTIFSPFTMGALMMWKNLMPLLLVTCTFDAVHLSVNVPTQSFFLLVLLMSDFMALHFFFLVRDYGSWLEIGTSISHYIIVMCLILFLILLLTLSKLFTRISLTRGQASKSHGQ